MLDHELSLLPDKYRAIIVLCDLEGKTRKQAAAQLGVPEGTVAGRQARGRAMLAKRLARHGFAVSGATLAGLLAQGVASASAPTSVVAATIKSASLAGGGLLSAKVAALAEGVVKAMLMTRLKMATMMVVLAMSVVGFGGVFSYCSMAGDQLRIEQASNQPTTEKTDEPEKQAAPKKEVNDLIQGTWDVTKIEVDGEVRNAEKEERWTIGNDKIEWSNRKRPVELTYAVVPTLIPRSIDMEISAGVGTGIQYKGIYALDGDTLKVCYQIGGNERPQAFQTRKGDSTRVLLVLKRKKRVADDASEKDSLIAHMKFVKVPKGTFWMGWDSKTKTSKQVEIKQDFELAAYTVTQEQWEAVMGAGSNPSWFSRQGRGKDKVKDVSDADLKRFPVEKVSWDEVQVFVKKLNEREKGKGWTYRLPKESEWEYACRGGATTKEECSFDFYFAKGTNDLSSKEANFNGEFPAGKGAKGPNLGRPTKVGSYASNKLGLYDMHGNVFQWCEEFFDNTNSDRVNRGGSWFYDAGNCRAAIRDGYAPAGRSLDLGFRLARVPSGKPSADKQQPKGVEEPGKDAKADKDRIFFGVVREVDEKSILLTSVSSERDRSKSKKPAPDVRVLLNEKTEYLRETGDDPAPAKLADVTKGKLVYIRTEKQDETLVAILVVLEWLQPGPPKLARLPDPSPDLRRELYGFDAYRHGSEEKFAELDRKADELLKKYTARDDQARIFFEVAHVAAQSDIRKHVKRVRRYAGKCLALSRDPLQRGTLYSYLGSAAEVEAENTFDDRRRQAAKELLTGYAEMFAQELPDKAPELPAVDILFGEWIDPIPHEAARKRHAAQWAARQEAEFIRALVDRRDTLAKQLRWLYHPDPRIHGRNPDGPEELRALAGKLLNDPKAAKALLAQVTEQ